MNILVLGGTRLMGKHLVEELLSAGHQVTIATRRNTPDSFGDRVSRIQVERTSPSNIKEALSHICYDVVFDSLAYCSNDVKYALDSLNCKKYVSISTTAVYHKHMDTREQEFNPSGKELIWCSRDSFPYDEIKRQAECAIYQAYPHIPSVCVRFPFVIGEDDYTQRLYFYIDHILHQKPMFIDNYQEQMAFVRSDEAGKFLAFLGERDFEGPINGASEQTLSIREIAEYVTAKTGKYPILSPDGERAPYNGEGEYSINIDRAKSLGFSFTPLHCWIYKLIDLYIDTIK